VKDGSINVTAGATDLHQRNDWTWNSPGLTYPGRLFAPFLLLCTVDECIMAASLNWASRLTVRPFRQMGPLSGRTTTKAVSLDFMEACLQAWGMIWCSSPNAFAAGQTEEISIILGSFKSDAASHTQAWQSAVVEYRTWLRSKLPKPAGPSHSPAVVVPQKMQEQEGMLEICLQCQVVFNMTLLNATWHEWKDAGYGRMQMWLVPVLVLFRLSCSEQSALLALHHSGDR
jgi:hypothetical protein